MPNIDEHGNFSQINAWSIKKSLFPNCRDAPSAVYDSYGNLITDKVGIINRIKEEFTFRLRNRESHQGYEWMRELKENLCQSRLNITKDSEYVPWSLLDLEKVLSKLKRNKARDPHGHVNELFKEMGIDGRRSLLTLLNRIKKELIVPNKLNVSDVTTILEKNIFSAPAVG